MFLGPKPDAAAEKGGEHAKDKKKDKKKKDDKGKDTKGKK